ncbi:Metal-dependent hydrolase, beta-lactamase superfamily II [Ruminococcus albus]|uniref:Metal-dependent hydrolase, beta-lactamase superfamily II n=2 Tax=Ruminococcus albus TaxID=1264 RepID=A0A1I1KMA1_RUMAL|nr:Metal-dependent hydrolase, beta-lactamase superfamily II [Ruminococcus albus]
MLRKFLCIAAAALTAFMSGCTAKTNKVSIDEVGDGLTIYSFKAGKADAELIYGDDWAVLIDCGEKGFGKEIVAYMEDNGIKKLDYLIITHFDKDHVGGAAKVLKTCEVGAVMQSNSPKESNEYENYLEALDNKGMTAQTVREKMTFTLGEAVFTVDPPAQEVYEKEPSNNSSLITEVTLGDVNMLFAGDAENDRLAEFTQNNNKTYRFVKVPYHGHWQKQLQPFAQSIKAEIAVITSSDEEPEDKQTVDLFKKCGAEVYTTKTDSVIVKCDGKNIAAAYDNS